ncbi:MAG: hypothetical protein GY787_31745 [Alteromonadales bacterium]|nr:hypothetical protein [Alteromonadales bacterium]
MARLFTPFQQFFDGSGEPLASGTIEFFESGVYSNQLDTYSDASLNNVNPNPITLDGEGYLPFDIFGDGVYSVELRDKNSILINLLDTVGGDTGSRTAFSDWTSTIIYNIPAFVVGSDGLYYRSLSNDNLGNDPIEDAGSNIYWEEFKLRGVYNSSVTYDIGDVVQTTVGNLWKALTSQSGNNPETDDGTNWVTAGDDNTDIPNDQTGTAYTLVITDKSKTVWMNNASTNAVTIPDNATVAFPINTTLIVMREGAGSTKLTADSGVSLNGVVAGSVFIEGQYSGATLVQRSIDNWVAAGAIGTVS